MTIEAGFRRVRGMWKLSTFLGEGRANPWSYAMVQARVLELHRKRIAVVTRKGAA